MWGVFGGAGKKCMRPPAAGHMMGGTPPRTPPDDPDHLALVLVLADGHKYPEYDGLMSPLSVYRTCYVYAVSIRACPLVLRRIF